MHNNANIFSIFQIFYFLRYVLAKCDDCRYRNSEIPRRKRCSIGSAWKVVLEGGSGLSVGRVWNIDISDGGSTTGAETGEKEWKPSAGKRRKGSEFFIGKNSIREREERWCLLLVILGKEDGRIGWRGPVRRVDRYPSIRKTVDPSSISTPFLHSIS